MGIVFSATLCTGFVSATQAHIREEGLESYIGRLAAIDAPDTLIECSKYIGTFSGTTEELVSAVLKWFPEKFMMKCSGCGKPVHAVVQTDSVAGDSQLLCKECLDVIFAADVEEVISKSVAVRQQKDEMADKFSSMIYAISNSSIRH